MFKESDARSAAIKDKRYLVAAGEGLYLEVFPSGRKVWLLRTSVGTKRPKFVLGDWPEMSLRDARAACAVRMAEVGRAAAGSGEAVYFGALLAEWRRVAFANCSDKYRNRMDAIIKTRIEPRFEHMLAGNVTSLDVLNRVREVESEGKYEVAHRVLSIFVRVFNFGLSKTVLTTNPAAALEGLLMPRNIKHYARVTDPFEVGCLMRSIAGYSRPRVRHALLFSAYVFGRPSEIRKAEWKEFDFNSCLWRLPAEKMKMRRPHIVPLARQVVDLLMEQRSLLAEYSSVEQRYVFPSERGPNGCMSADTVRCALRGMGYGQDDMTAHGFRSMASTILNESGLWGADAIERQLAHCPADRVRETYNYAQFVPERTRMMQWYADELDRLRDEG